MQVARFCIGFAMSWHNNDLSCLMTKPSKWLHPAKTQISLGISPVWSGSSLYAWRKFGSLATHWVHSENSDETGSMPRLIWVFAGCTVILLVLTWGGSFQSCHTQFGERFSHSKMCGKSYTCTHTHTTERKTLSRNCNITYLVSKSIFDSCRYVVSVWWRICRNKQSSNLETSLKAVKQSMCMWMLKPHSRSI